MPFSHRSTPVRGAAAALALAAGIAAGGAVQPAAAAAENPNDWPLYHRSATSDRHSPLSQIDRGNVKDLEVAWIHQPGAITHGLQATPIAVDGVVYYIAADNRVFAVDGASGRQLWHWFPELDPVVEEMFFQPYSRGVTVGHGMVYVATLDGRGVALDQRTGAVKWERKLLDPRACGGCNFTSPPVLAGDKLTFGPTGGDIGQRGKIYALDARTGEPAWTFETLKDDPASWGGDSIRTGGGGAWMPGTYDPVTRAVFYGTSNPAPDFDWGAARPGDNLYTSSVVALDPDTGKVKWHHQEIPHDAWDFDAANGEVLIVERDGERSIVHYNKSGFVFVYDPANGRLKNVWPLAENYNFADGIDPKTGQMINRRDPKAGEKNFVCPWLLGTKSWNHGAYNAQNGLWYVPAMEACQYIEIERSAPEATPLSGLWYGGTATATHPPDREAYGRLDARDPLTGKRTWTVSYRIPLLSSVLSTAGGLVFVGDLQGHVRAYDADNGQELWTFNTGSGIRSGLITYAANGEQYVLVPSGIGSHSVGFFAQLWPEVLDYPAGAALVAFKLKR